MAVKEDGTTLLNGEATQDYIHELESKVRKLIDNASSLSYTIEDYQGEQGPHLVFKDMLYHVLKHDADVIDVIKDEVLGVLPDFDDIEYRVVNLEDEKLEDYDIIDTVLDSGAFERSVHDIVIDKLSEVKFNVTIVEE